MKKIWKKLAMVILRLICLPSDLVAFLIVLGAHVLWGGKLDVRRGILATELKADSWPMRTWYKDWGATTFGHAIMFGNGYLEDKVIFNHELVHVEQFESECVQGLMIACVLFYLGAPWWGIAVFMFNGALNYVASVITAVLRGESPYRGSHLEEAAYATHPDHSH